MEENTEGVTVPTVRELLDANLHRVFDNRSADDRRAVIDEIYTEDVLFTDPDGPVTGRDALEARAATLLGELPEAFAFAEDGIAYTSADSGALAWTVGPAGGEPVVRGIDVITVRDGRIATLLTIVNS